MPKTDLTFVNDQYAPVADRIRLFYDRFPDGRIVTKLIARTERDVVVRAAVFRHASDVKPAATGWAAEREGDGEINTVACLENTETSAVGRALANLGLTGPLSARVERRWPKPTAFVRAWRARLSR